MKNNANEDITRRIISSGYVAQNLHNFFPDSLFLDQHYNIVAVSAEVARCLGYGPNELTGESLSILHSEAIRSWLSQHLIPGFFVNQKHSVKLKSGQSMDYMISGFYLGILGPYCDLIILRFYPCSVKSDLVMELKESRCQIDNFIYRTAHDLRGPLATVQGLIYLLKLREDEKEVDNFISLISANCKKLEERLTNLSYLSKADEDFKLPSYRLRVSDLETALRRTVERNSFVDYLKLWVSGPKEVIEGFNEVSTLSIVNNILMYILSLPLIKQANIYVDICQTESLNICMRAAGFEKDPKIEQVIQEADVSHYVDVLQTSNFTYLYAALKIAANIDGRITYEYKRNQVQEITVIISKGMAKSPG